MYKSTRHKNINADFAASKISPRRALSSPFSVYYPVARIRMMTSIPMTIIVSMSPNSCRLIIMIPRKTTYDFRLIFPTIGFSHCHIYIIYYIFGSCDSQKSLIQTIRRTNAGRRCLRPKGRRAIRGICISKFSRIGQMSRDRKGADKDN